jgi:hypothetical protein
MERTFPQTYPESADGGSWAGWDCSAGDPDLNKQDVLRSTPKYCSSEGEKRQPGRAWVLTRQEMLLRYPSAKRHVLCQEIGHTFGLDHQYTEPTCMDDINGLFDPAFVGPGAHDFEQLGSIYAHRHSVAPAQQEPGNSGLPGNLVYGMRP